MSFQIKQFNSIVDSMINWVQSNTSKLTDFSIGSVTRTIMEAIAQEIEELYYQIYRGLIEAIEYIYIAFNFPKIPAMTATGTVRFSATTISVPTSIPSGTRVGTNENTVFQTTQNAILGAQGTSTGGNDSTHLNDTNASYGTNQFNGGTIKIVAGTGSGQSSTVTSNSPTQFVVSPAWSVTPDSTSQYQVIGNNFYSLVPVQAVVPGASGNAAANTVINILTTIPGVTTVTNPNPFTSGRDEETTTDRQARFSIYINSLSKGTLDAIEEAALSADPAIITAKAIDDLYATCLSYSQNSTSYTDNSLEGNTPYGTPFNALTGSVIIGDALYIGSTNAFDFVNLFFDQPAVVTTGTGIFEYYNINSNAWATLTVVDNTSGLTKSGTVMFTPPSSWGLLTILTAPVPWSTTPLLYIRFRVTATGWTTAPTLQYVTLAPGSGATYLYASDASGNLSIVQQNEILANMPDYRAIGTRVIVRPPILLTLNVTGTITTGPMADHATLAAAVAVALTDYLNQLSLGTGVNLSQLTQIAMDVDSVNMQNVKFTAPTGDILGLGSTVIRAGTVVIL